MRSLLGLLLLTGCMTAAESHGTTAKEYKGTVDVLIVNATPEKMCGLYMSYDTDADYGDNWLPVAGLPVGQAAEFKVKPGTYKAKWNSCKDMADAPTANYSATLVAGTAFPLTEDIQLYAFVSDGTPPTKRAMPRPKLKMVKFIGQTTYIAKPTVTAAKE
jgi:hypothetical protein